MESKKQIVSLSIVNSPRAFSYEFGSEPFGFISHIIYYYVISIRVRVLAVSIYLCISIKHIK